MKRKDTFKRKKRCALYRYNWFFFHCGAHFLSSPLAFEKSWPAMQMLLSRNKKEVFFLLAIKRGSNGCRSVCVVGWGPCVMGSIWQRARWWSPLLLVHLAACSTVRRWWTVGCFSEISQETVRLYYNNIAKEIFAEHGNCFSFSEWTNVRARNIFLFSASGNICSCILCGGFPFHLLHFFCS